MTKDWDSVRSKIRDLSVNQRKSLEEVKKIMEDEWRFRASTRAYRMKLKEWGYTRHKPRPMSGDKGRRDKGSSEEGDAESGHESEASATAEERVPEGNSTLLREAEDLLPVIDPWSQGGIITSAVLMDMLDAVLESDSQKLEQLIIANPDHVNLPIGTPFQVPGGRFFNHPAMQQCVVLEHANQTLMDIACALPAGPAVWVLVANGANGSTHPLGTDLAFHNAIKNGRNITCQSLLFSGRSNVNGVPGTTWKPLLQAVFWNVPDVVRILLDRGANVNGTAPMLDGMPLKTALQLALERRANNYHNQPVRERSERTLKMLLDAGANIHVPPAIDLPMTPFETFVKPWQSNPYWSMSLSQTDLDVLEAFLRKGADLHITFTGLPCSAPTGNTFEHQVLWHSTPSLARLLIDHAIPSPEANGANILHEILGSCPDAKRHPAETLRDIEVLMQRGADPNLTDRNGLSPLRTCIDRCPAVDILPRLQALLKGGADPEVKGNDGNQPLVIAARMFEEPLKSQVLHLLVAKYRGRFPQVWHERYFPISTEPTLAEVLKYSEQNGGFAAETQRTVPEDVKSDFQRAAFSVVTKNFLDAVTHRAKSDPGHGLSNQERDELQHVIVLRQASGLPTYSFDQDLILALLMSPSHSLLSQPTTSEVLTNTSGPTCSHPLTPSILSSLNDLTFPTPMDIDIPLSISSPQHHPTSRRGSASSVSSNASAVDFFIPATTQIRWSKLDQATSHGDLKKASKRVLKYRCRSCADGNLLTKDEFRRHEDEHLHTIGCKEVGCGRRFCVAERG